MLKLENAPMLMLSNNMDLVISNRKTGKAVIFNLLHEKIFGHIDLEGRSMSTEFLRVDYMKFASSIHYSKKKLVSISI